MRNLPLPISLNGLEQQILELILRGEAADGPPPAHGFSLSLPSREHRAAVGDLRARELVDMAGEGYRLPLRSVLALSNDPIAARWIADTDLAVRRLADMYRADPSRRRNSNEICAEASIESAIHAGRVMAFVNDMSLLSGSNLDEWGYVGSFTLAERVIDTDSINVEVAEGRLFGRYYEMRQPPEIDHELDVFKLGNFEAETPRRSRIDKGERAMGGRDTKNNSEPTPATVKRLFALSRNRCAFNDCNTPLVRESKVTGKVCHIKAAQKGGPRYDPSQSSDERRGFGNLVLLCGECHDVIDDPKNSEKYSVSVLTRMKEDHEQQAETTLTNEMTEAFVHSARASVSVGSMQESAIANLEAPNNSGVLTQLVGNFHGPVFVGGSPTSPPATAAEAEPTLISLSGRLFRGRFQSMTSSTWVVALHSAIGGGGELDLASTAAWFHRVAKHYVALARPGVAREFVGPPEFHREGTAILATLAVRPEVARTSVTLIGRDLDLTRIGEGGGLTPGGLHDVPRVLRQVLSAGVGEVNLQEGSGSFISAYARTFAADPALLADLLALEIARLAFITADGATKPALTFVRGVNSITITRADDLLVAHLDLDLMGVGSWSGQVEIFVSDELGSEVQKALDAVGESMRERCSTCGLPAMGTPRDFYECGNCGAVAPKPKMVEVSPAQARRTLKRGQNYT